MSVLTFSAGARFVARVIKSYTTNPSRQWGNTYEFRAQASGAEATLLALGTALVNFEIALHNTFTNFDRLTISTWEADSVPYDPAAFISTTLTGAGTRDTTGELEPITTCFSVARAASSGRTGHMFYRGVLSQADTSAPAGITLLNDKAAMQAEVEAALTSSGFGDYIGVAPEADLGLVLINKDGTNTRAVVELLASGVVQLPVDHAWFNRTSP